MFERFTDRARRVLVLAQEEARLLNHSFIGTEHLLLGLLHEDRGLAYKALESFRVTLEAVRERVEATIGSAGSSPSGSPPFTPRSKKVMELSFREALHYGHNYIGTEHLLLGLIREGEGVAPQVLVSLGVDLERLRQRVLELMGDRVPEEEPDDPDWPKSGRVLDRGTIVICSFCGRRPPDSGEVIAGRNAFICEQCLTWWAAELGASAAGSPGRGKETPAEPSEPPPDPAR